MDLVRTRLVFRRILKPSPFKMGCLVVLLSCLFYAFKGHNVDLINQINDRITDAMFLWRGQEGTTDQVVIIDIDEKSLKAVGQWPWPRDVITRLVRRISEQGPKVVGFDILFAEPDRTSPKNYFKTREEIFKDRVPASVLKEFSEDETLDFDMMLGRALSESPTVLGYSFVSEDEVLKLQSDPPFPSCQIRIAPKEKNFDQLDLLSADRAVTSIVEVAQAESEGFITLTNVSFDSGGVVRKVPLFITLDHVPYPSLALEVYRIGQQEPEMTLHVSQQVKAERSGLLGVSIGDSFIPTDDQGRMTINFRGPEQTFPYISAVDVLEGEARVPLKDKYILIGTSATTLGDMNTTPFTRGSFPGVEVHANIIDNMVAVDPLKHDAYEEIALTYTIIVFGGLLLTILLVYAGPLMGGFGGLLILILTFMGNYYFFFLNHKLIGTTYPLLSFLALFIAVTTFNYLYEGRARRFIHKAFGHYVSPEVVSQLVKNPDQLSLKGEQKELTLLFSDIRGFTRISEGMGSEALGYFMNQYLTAMSDVVMEHGGTVDKYIGDSIMAMWGAPHNDPNHAANTVRCALGMIERLHRIRPDWEKRGLPRLEIGIGINTGVVSVGNFGSRDRFDYTVMGDHVNLASRLEGINKNYGTRIIISEYTKKAITDRFLCRFVDTVLVKGKDEPVSIYEPLSEEKIDESLIEEVNAYEGAVAEYQARNFQKAYDLFGTLYERNPTRLYAVYMHRAKGFISSPPPADWDGVERRSQLLEKLEI